MRNIGIFCGSKPGNDPAYARNARSVGEMLASSGTLVYFGGGNIGLMGEIAESVLRSGGRISGVIPSSFRGKEVIHKGLTELIVTATRSECKTMIYDRSDAILVLPGGFGTVDEFTEFLTLGKLGQHSKPIGILNTRGFFDHFITFIDRMIDEGFMGEKYREIILFDEDPEYLLLKLRQRVASGQQK